MTIFLSFLSKNLIIIRRGKYIADFQFKLYNIINFILLIVYLLLI